MTRTRILYLSRHPLRDEHTRELREHFGSDIIVDMDARPFKSTRDILQRMERGGYQELIAVAPILIIEELCRSGISVITPVMKAIDEDEIGEEKSRTYIPAGFRRIDEVVSRSL